MPCLPMGISVRYGRTSALKRLRSMPRYRGASRKRSTRGFMLRAARRCLMHARVHARAIFGRVPSQEPVLEH